MLVGVEYEPGGVVFGLLEVSVSDEVELVEGVGLEAVLGAARAGSGGGVVGVEVEEDGEVGY